MRPLNFAVRMLAGAAVTPSQIARGIAKGWLALGSLGLGLTAVASISHYVLGTPIHEGHASAAHVATVLVALAVGFGFFAIAGFWLLFRSPWRLK